jgi:hypothetical protein
VVAAPSALVRLRRHVFVLWSAVKRRKMRGIGSDSSSVCPRAAVSRRFGLKELQGCGSRSGTPLGRRALVAQPAFDRGKLFSLGRAGAQQGATLRVPRRLTRGKLRAQPRRLLRSRVCRRRSGPCRVESLLLPHLRVARAVPSQGRVLALERIDHGNVELRLDAPPLVMARRGHVGVQTLALACEAALLPSPLQRCGLLQILPHHMRGCSLLVLGVHLGFKVF